ncbi:hypothetical protein [Paraburkholderia sp.]|uniref:hypothetical protein n=1 Tax=Paraburkholderia sp. TaxID=1926495 RepID=UPI0039C9C5B3
MSRDLQKDTGHYCGSSHARKWQIARLFRIFPSNYCDFLHAQSDVIRSLTNGFAGRTSFRAPLQGAQRFGQALDALQLRRHQIGARNRRNATAPVRKRNAVSARQSCDDLLEMLNILFELMMIHSWPRDSSNFRKTPFKMASAHSMPHNEKRLIGALIGLRRIAEW